MNSSSIRIRKRRALQRPLPDPHQAFSVLQRRSSQIQPSLRATSPVGATSYTRVSASGLVEISAPVPSRIQFKEYTYPPEIHNDQTRKRRFNTSIKTSAERPLKRARLTKKNLKTFEKLGGRKRNDPKPESSQSQSNSSRSRAKSKFAATTESTSKKVSMTDTSFPRLAFGNGVLDPVHSTPNENLDFLQDQLDRIRGTSSPTESEYKNFASRIQKAPNETTVLLETSKLLKEYGRGYRRVYSQAFHSFPKDVGLNDGYQLHSQIWLKVST
ncbi:hypothetical protein ACMFMG_011309 [Clarireedia jacksonii]